MKKLTVTIGIPTCYGGISLLRVIRSLRKSRLNFEIRVVADTVPLPDHIKKELNNLQVVLVENKNSGSQISKVKQMIAATKSDIFIFTQDDVRFDLHTLDEIKKIFLTHPDVTMVGARIVAEKATTIFESLVEVGLRVVDHIASRWNRGDNYLSANGRCLAFRMSHLKKMRIPDNLVNTDAYLYFENERSGGKFLRVEKALVYNPSPTRLSEQLRQTERFLYSQPELKHHFGTKILSRYRVPLLVSLQAGIAEFFTHPLLWFCYIFVFILGNIKMKLFPRDLTPLWQVNLSTKKDG